MDITNKKIRLATVFSGIGAIEFALKRLNIPHELVFACDNGEVEINYDKEKEINYIRSLKNQIDKKKYVDTLYSSKTRKNNFVKQSYLKNYDLDEDNFYQDICLLDGTDFENKVDLFVGGSPCQSFSSVGYQRGLEDTRGTLFYEYARLIKEIKPKVFIYENVKNLLTHDHGNTWSVVKGVFDTLGYNIDFGCLNSVDFGIPQNRRRLFVIGYRKDFEKIPSLPTNKENSIVYDMHDFLQSHCGFGKLTYDLLGELVIDNSVKDSIDNRYFLSPAVEKYVMTEGTKNWKTSIKIDLPIARTLLKTMGNCHRAGVDNYIRENGKIRMLTEREAHRLMGFTDDYKIVVSTAQAYKQAGNSIVVDVLMEILKAIIKDKII